MKMSLTKILVNTDKWDELQKLLRQSHEHCDGQNECSICDEPLIDVMIREVKELRQWKESAISIMPDWRELGRALGIAIGQDVPPLILSKVQELRAEVERMKKDDRQSMKDWQIREQQLSELTANLQSARKAMEMARDAFSLQASNLDRITAVRALNTELEKSDGISKMRD